MHTVNWKTATVLLALALLLLAPRFGHAGDPESKEGGLLAATYEPAVAQPRLTVELVPEEASPNVADLLVPFSSLLEAQGVVAVELKGPGTEVSAAAYSVEIGISHDTDRSEATDSKSDQQLRIRVLSREGQVLLAFRSPLAAGQAREGALEASAERLATWFAGRSWSSSVLSRDGNRVTIHGGWLHQLAPGLELQAVAHRPVFDDAGHVLGAASTPIGLLRLVAVEERTATAEIMSGCELLSKGTEVILAAQTAP